MNITSDVLRSLADPETDFCQGDIVYNSAIKILALRELLRIEQEKTTQQSDTIASYVRSADYWRNRAVELGHTNVEKANP